MTRRHAVAAGALAVMLAAGAWRAMRRQPDAITVEDVVQDLMATFAPATVVRQSADAAVATGSIQPSAGGKMEGAARRAIVAPPPAVIRFRVHVPADAVLEVSTGVEGSGRRDADAGGIRFGVAVDGREVLARTMNPARSRHDRRWIDDRIPLAGTADRDVEITLTTDADGHAPRLAGRPGWSHVRVVRATWRARQRTRPDAPNVLVVLVDTLRADRLGCYGAPAGASPAVDRLATRGVLFTHAIAQSSWTMTSVASLFSGLHPRSHGVFGIPRSWATPAGAAPDTDWGHLADTIPTLADQARRAGITTVAVSANPLVSSATNLDRGFETFVQPDGTPWPRAAAVNARFLDWVRAHRGIRFFGYLHYMDVHGPYTPPAALRPPPPAGVRNKVATGDIDELARRINWQGAEPLTAPEVDHLRALYAGAIRAWDTELQALLDALAGAGVLDSTVVVVTADHGEEFQEHARLGHGSQLYDESIRVPLVIAGPGIAPGRIDTQAQGIDLFPTVAALLGIAPPAGLPGRNALVPGDDRPVLSETRYGIAPDGRGTEVVALRTEAWKLVQLPALGRYELYDLRDDPAERRNVYTDAPEAAALVARLAAWQAPAAPVAPADDRAPQVVEKLRALGYVE